MGTVGNELTILRGFVNGLKGKDLEKPGQVTRQDVERFLAKRDVERRWASRTKDGTVTATAKRTVRIADTTHRLRWDVLRPFFRWLRDTGDESPEEVRGIKVRRVTAKVPMDRVPTPEKLQRLLKANPGAEEQAILAVLFESGLRAGEFTSLRVGHIEFHGDGTAHLHLPSQPGEGTRHKTGRRDVLIVDSVPQLERWTKEHPHRADADGALWLNTWGRPLTPSALYGWLARMEAKAGLKLRMSPHKFRHGSATWAATLGLSERALNARFGWSESSGMASRYVHASGRDYEALYLEKLGIQAPKERGRAIPPRVCVRCKHPNVPNADFCTACKAPVSPEGERIAERLRGEAARGTERERLKALVGDVLLEVLSAGQDESKLDAPAARLLALLQGRNGGVGPE